MEFIDEVMQEAKEIASRSPSSPTYSLYKLAESFYNKLDTIPNEVSKLDIEQIVLFLVSSLFVGTPRFDEIMKKRVEIFEKIASST
jgi:hypothetical protein